jgi:SanA protein
MSERCACFSRKSSTASDFTHFVGRYSNAAFMITRDRRWLSAGADWVRFPLGLFWPVLGGAGFFLVLSNWWVSRAGGYSLFDSVPDIPENEVGLVLGAAPTLASGLSNRYFVFRMDSAAQLFHAGKVKVLILSGNRRGELYDEPAEMRKALINRGVPDQVLVEDPGGVRTIESVARAKLIFGVERLTIISQEFHNRRALFFCRHYDIEAVALNADSVGRQQSWRLIFREFVARTVAVLDLWRRRR